MKEDHLLPPLSVPTPPHMEIKRTLTFEVVLLHKMRILTIRVGDCDIVKNTSENLMCAKNFRFRKENSHRVFGIPLQGIRQPPKILLS